MYSTAIFIAFMQLQNIASYSGGRLIRHKIKIYITYDLRAIFF